MFDIKFFFRCSAVHDNILLLRSATILIVAIDNAVLIISTYASFDYYIAATYIYNIYNNRLNVCPRVCGHVLSNNGGTTSIYCPVTVCHRDKEKLHTDSQLH